MAHKKLNKFNKSFGSAVTSAGTSTDFLEGSNYGNTQQITIDITEETRGGSTVFRAKMRGIVDGGSWYIEWSQNELVAEASDILNEARKLTTISCDDQCIKNVAKIGYGHFLKIFPNKGCREDLTRALANKEVDRISVVSNSFIYPWGLLFPINPDAEIDKSKFLGMQCVFFRKFDDSYSNNPPPNYQISAVENMAELTFGWHNSLQEAQNIELPHIRTLAKRGDISGEHELPALQDNKGASENIEILKDAIETHRSPMIHLACHAENGEVERAKLIQLRNNARLTLSDMRIGELSLGHNPIVFLNACRLGFADPRYFASFIGYFEGIGALSIIAPECEIGDQRAAEFAKVLLDKIFIDRKDVCEALLFARLNRLSDSNDLTGLVYSLYGRPDTLIKKNIGA